MASQVYRNVTCNNCNTVMEYDVYDSINATLQPKLKEKIVNDELFVLTCPECGKKFYLSYGFLYNDIDCGHMIHYSCSEDITNELQQFKDIVGNFKKEISAHFNSLSYKFRFVNDFHKLKEKIRIFDKNLDDRIIELYKYEFIVNGYDKDLSQLDDIVFVNVDGSSEFVFVLFEKDVIENVRAISFDEMEYTRLEKEYEDYLSTYDDVEIDLVWAQNVYNSVNINN